MKVKLTENIHGIGKAGDIVELDDIKAKSLGSSAEEVETKKKDFEKKTKNRQIKKKK